MAHDAELDRLKVAQDLAYQRKQNAYNAMQAAWQKRSVAHDTMDRAYYDKQIAYKVMNDAWQNYQFVRQHNGPRIDGLNNAQEDAFQNMKQYFDSASNAYEARDGASAKYYAEQGHYYKQVAQDCVVERRRLVQEIRDARERHEATRPVFEHAKAIFMRAKEEFSRAKEEHLRAQEEFKRAKEDFTTAASAFKKRLEKVRDSNRQASPILSQMARKAWAHRPMVTCKQIQYEDGNYKVKVKAGHSHKKGCTTTDIIIADRHNAGGYHHHIVLDDRGNVIIDEQRKDR